MNSSNLKKRVLIIGDVHGCFLELKKLLIKCAYNKEKDRLIFVGDLINKGPDSLAVLEWVKNEKAETILGNHELRFLSYLQGGDPQYKALVQLKKEMKSQVSYWQKWLSQLPYYIESNDFLVIHAGLKPGEHPSQSKKEVLTTIRTWDQKGEDLNNPNNPPWFHFYKSKKLVVFGHWAKKGLLQKDNVIGLDSGCVYGNYLSALSLPERKIYQVKAEKNYDLIYGEKV